MDLLELIGRLEGTPAAFGDDGRIMVTILASDRDDICTAARRAIPPDEVVVVAKEALASGVHGRNSKIMGNRIASLTPEAASGIVEQQTATGGTRGT